ncbi:ANTAR domain-containing protein [Hylemonella gracilis]|jgi:AmiR/NasT family two-component response regulator|uniref:ANTAR domain-containing protein n=1 Tax=Hylemonella gracilis TaxID=80880 RepID=A0A4V1A1T5_9BURK|nr:ANTAR domain-containing protein [Hylemonella gracilis]QBK03669.1 ANTAR domain-containing protein [Hylemonella gracilis]
MTALHTPTFAGWTCLILAWEDKHTQRLARQLRVLGIEVLHQEHPLDATQRPHLIVIDADQGLDAMLPSNKPGCPVIALLSSEAPGRLAWALRHGAGAFVPKPVPVSAVYPALVLARSHHEAHTETTRRIHWLEERLRLRPVVFAALNLLKTGGGLSDDEAYAQLRENAMQERMSIEQMAALLLDGGRSARKKVTG